MQREASDVLTTLLEKAVGTSVLIRTRTALLGGDINRAEKIETSAGVFFVKSNTKHLPNLFTSEAEGLRALRNALKESGTSLRIPNVIAALDPTPTSPGFLVLEHLEPGPKKKTFDEELGRGLADLHQHHGPAFGFSIDNYCGTTSQPNAWSPDWVSFYIDSRLRHQLTIGQQKGLFDRTHHQAFERLFGRLPELLEPDAACAHQASLIHGDLWSGNVHVAPDGSPALIDPSCSYADREAEFGMMLLFGGFTKRTFDAYQEALPLSAGWKSRNPLYQLYHVMNHANLFGGGYVDQALSIVRRFI